jgi:phosphoglycerate kinase
MKTAKKLLALLLALIMATSFASVAFAANEESESNATPASANVIGVGSSINAKLDECKTLVWNGPLGVFEMKPFDTATNAVAEHAAELTVAGKLTSVAGGGDTVSALENAGVANKFTYISTAGGAFLEWMEGKELPGVQVMKK